MSKKRVLFVTQEMNPYTTISAISEKVRALAPHVQGGDFDIRVLMPKYGVINERRHRLHEVVRLSGMNIIVDDDDFPLIIKVASLPGTRLQVYFLDNEEFFKRKFIFNDAEEKPFDDNHERMVFFCKGVIETVKKFGWPPDIVHCSGWFTSLVPLFLKKVYTHDPVFENAKIVYSMHEENYSQHFSDRFIEIASINDLQPEDMAPYLEDGKVNLNQGATTYADAIVKGSEDMEAKDLSAWDDSEKPKLDFFAEEEFKKESLSFFKDLLN